MSLTDEQIHALRVLAGARSLVSAQELVVPVPALTGLVRRGLVLSFDQSEQVRGERRVYYRLYRITDAGRDALASWISEHD